MRLIIAVGEIQPCDLAIHKAMLNAENCPLGVLWRNTRCFNWSEIGYISRHLAIKWLSPGSWEEGT